MPNALQSNSKRIAKNTITLYIRMMVSTVVSLFTARLTLQILRVEDFGIYNVVGGIIGFAGIFSTTMSSATQRFLAFELGANNLEGYQRVYSMMINIFCIFGIFVCLTTEFLGQSLVTNTLNIPQPRLEAAIWVFHFTVLNFFISTVSTPLTASIVSYEKMGIYAYFTIIDVIFKLLIVFALYFLSADKLIMLSGLTMTMTLLTNIVLGIYCTHKLPGCKYLYVWDNKLFSKISSYAGWNLLGATTGIMNYQGQAIVLNMFFGPVVNAAKAIADRINQTISSFSLNFYMAVAPQIIKSYASGDIEYMQKLVLSSSRYAYFLLLCISAPIITQMKPLLVLWLDEDNVTPETVYFSQLILIYALVNILEQPITQAIRATGNIKKYQIIVGSITLSFIPICYICFLCGMPAYSSMLLLIIVYTIAHIFRILLVKTVIKISLYEYTYRVFIPILLPTLTSVGLLCIMPQFDDYTNFLCILANLTAALLITILCITILGVSSDERNQIIKIIKTKIL